MLRVKIVGFVQFKQLCAKLSPGMEDDAMKEALADLDSDGDGEISFDGTNQPSTSIPTQKT